MRIVSNYFPPSQTMLKRTEGSSKEEQIYRKEQILAELQVRLALLASAFKLSVDIFLPAS